MFQNNGFNFILWQERKYFNILFCIFITTIQPELVKLIRRCFVGIKPNISSQFCKQLERPSTFLYWIFNCCWEVDSSLEARFIWDFCDFGWFVRSLGRDSRFF